MSNLKIYLFNPEALYRAMDKPLVPARRGDGADT